VSERASVAAEEQAASISQVSTNVESLSEQAEALQGLLASFEVSGTQSGSRTPDDTVAVGDGGRKS
jgi:hypothetical protein